MLRQYLNFRIGLALLAVVIVTGTIFYSNFLSKKIASEEREKISQWVEANKFIASAPPGTDLTLASQIQQQNNDIPVIWTNEKDSIIDFRNIDSRHAPTQKLLEKKLDQFRKAHPPIVLVLSQEPYIADKYFYGDSELLTQIRYFPIVQLLVVALFIIIIIYSISTRNKATQNQVWAGMARETAHQLGTPLTSLQGWIEILKEQNNAGTSVADEMKKDVERLRLISDRFGKIGSAPHLDPNNITVLIQNMISYIRHIAPKKVSFFFHPEKEETIANVSPPLFDWVIENLLKNALDAMNGQGEIHISLHTTSTKILIDVRDNGKGISNKIIKRIFKPGFSTKRRGWGLGLSLCKRIIEQYHKGQLFVKNTEIGKGTTFRIILNRDDEMPET